MMNWLPSTVCSHLMRCRLPIVVLVLVLLPAVCLRADDLRFTRLTDYFEALRAQAGIPGLSAIVVGPEDILWEHAFGQADIGRSISTRINTPFQLDGLTQVFTTVMTLRCVEEGTLSLSDRIGSFDKDSPDTNATIEQVLTHTSGPPTNLAFSYRPDRLAPLTRVIRVCAVGSYRKTLSNLLDRLAMVDSVPGPDAARLQPPAEGVPTPATAARYLGVLTRLAQPYAVSPQGRASLTQYAATTLTPAGGLISTVLDLAQFDLALKQGILLRADTLAAAWRAPVNSAGQRLPHGMGWFVQQYNGVPIVWQFGSSDEGSSSLLITVPARGLTMILLANSNGLSKPFSPNPEEVTVSPFARVFLGLFVR
jgi:CubicO group peptidase (beta-lactamase class C family)